jgi:hypothetical protein
MNTPDFKQCALPSLLERPSISERETTPLQLLRLNDQLHGHPDVVDHYGTHSDPLGCSRPMHSIQPPNILRHNAGLDKLHKLLFAGAPSGATDPRACCGNLRAWVFDEICYPAFCSSMRRCMRVSGFCRLRARRPGIQVRAKAAVGFGRARRAEVDCEASVSPLNMPSPTSCPVVSLRWLLGLKPGFPG